MVKSFYDPRVEEKGIQIGMEKGIEKGKNEGIVEGKKTVARNMLLDGESDERIKKYTGLCEEDINKIKELIKVQGEH